MPGHARTRGFTLIEVLVVVAIIALLVAILLPSLAQAREMARRAKCGVGLHTLAQAVHIYAAEDKKGYFPDLHNSTYRWNTPAYAPPGTPGVKLENESPYVHHNSLRARDWMMKQYKLERESFYCPSNPAWNKDNHWAMNSTTSVWGYVYLGNCSWFNDISYMAGKGMRWHNPAPDPKRMPMTAYKLTDKPQQKLLWADLTRSEDEVLDGAKSGANHIRGALRVGKVLPRSGGAHIGYMDGHVEWRRPTQMKLRVARGRYEVFW